MTTNPVPGRRPLCWLLAVLVLLTPGAARRAHASPPCAAGAECCDGRDQVHVYVLGGIDPFGWADLPRFIATIRSWGYRHVSLAGYGQARRFERDIRRVHAANPHARFAIIGLSAGAVTGQWLTWRLLGDGVPVALLVYLDGKWVSRSWPAERVAPPPRTVNVIAPCYLRCAPVLPWARNLWTCEGWHFYSANSPRTLAVLHEELAAVAASVSPP
jgi:hypothetical protein